MLVELIQKHYAQEEEDRKWASPIRMSSAGQCARKIAYQLHGFKMEPLSARARMLFRLGDLVEKDLVEVSVKYGLVDMQKEVEVEIAGHTIKGHIDGRVGDTVVDFKSCSDYAFKLAESGKIDESYSCNMHMYMKGMGLKKALLVYYKKHTSHICEVEINWDDRVWDTIVNRWVSVLNSDKDSLPAREYGPNAKGKLPWNCSYCSACQHCWPDFELTFTKQGKPELRRRSG